MTACSHQYCPLTAWAGSDECAVHLKESQERHQRGKEVNDMDDDLKPISTGQHRHVVDPTANGCSLCAAQVAILEVIVAWLRSISERTPAQVADALEPLIIERRDRV
jgi:hypothetical protein